jgi:hypothetical protein
MAAMVLRRSRIRSACRCEWSPARRARRRRAGSNQSRRAWCPSLRAASGRWRRPGFARQAGGQGVLPLPVKPKLSGKASVACSIRCMWRARRAGGGAGAGGRAGAAAHHRGQARGDGFVSLLRTDKMNVRVKPPAVTINPSPAMTSVVTPTIMPGDARHDVGIARLADAGDQAVLDADVGLVNAGVIHDQGVGDDAIQRSAWRRRRRPGPAFADGFAAAEFAFVAIDGKSRSTSRMSEVSPRRTRSPVVGPNISA